MTQDNAVKLRRLYELYEQPMYRIAYAVLKNTASAEDAVSDAFEKIIRKIGRIGDPDSPKTKGYIVKTIKNTSIDRYRKNQAFYEKCCPIGEEAMQLIDSSVDIESDVIEKENMGLLDSLNERDRQIIMLRCSDGLSWREAAYKLSMSETGIRKRFERIKLSLKGELYNEKK